MSKKTHPQLCYFPTSVLFMDDDKRFLSSICLNLDKKTPFRRFTKPELALKHLGNKQNSVLDTILAELNTESDDERSFKINSASFHDIIHYPQRFAEISVVVVDYVMPDMNGIQFCQALQDLPIKKIMLTGKGDSKLAMDAFNDGLIDKFILKNDSNMVEQLSAAIAEKQLEYFSEHLSVFDRKLLDTHIIPCYDESFRHFFNQIRDELNISEYYAFDLFNGFLLLDFEGNAYWLLAVHEDTITTFYEGTVNDIEASDNLVTAIASRKQLPLLLKNKDAVLSVEEWENNLHPIKPLQNSNYYYAIIEESQAKKLIETSILSHKQFFMTEKTSL